MSSDPYFDLVAEVESTLAALSTQLAAFLRLSHSSASDELAWALSELKATLVSLEADDLADLEESVKAVEEPGVARRLGLRDLEVKERRAFVERVRQEIANTRKALGTHASPRIEPRKSFPDPKATYKSSYPLHPSDEDDGDDSASPNDRFEMQHQSLLMEQQDRTLTDISGTVDMLRQQAKTMGREVLDQNAMLEELDHQVDRTASNLAKAQKRLQNFVKENKNSPSSWCILLLMIILSILLFIILFL